MAFIGRDKGKVRAATIEDLYKDLPRTRQAVDNLWVHQGDVLRRYQEHFQNAPDLALELPTGTGKTLPGLLVAEWARTARTSRVVYACPTSQLARQVLQTAQREGVSAVLLIGPHREWPTVDQSAYEASEAVAITNYSTIFNTNPHLAEPQVIVFDDAHAGEQFVGEQYSLRINRWESLDAYLAVLETLAPLLTPLLVQRLRGDADPGVHHQVRLLTPALDPAVMSRLDSTLAALPKPHNFQLGMIRNELAASLVYLTYSSIQIRPLIPPTFESRLFSGALQRVYLSATLGDGGELERAFGRRHVDRLTLPAGTQPRSGRRLFVFPDVTAGTGADQLTRAIVARAGKAIVLTQTTLQRARDVALHLADGNMPVFGREDVDSDLGVFARADTGVLGLANRYDGLDLPDDACRVVVLDGLPNASSLQEKFLGERADARTAMAERLRTRVVQGAGRCTRGPSDFAVVVVRGADITRYLRRPEVREALDPELQAELEFGYINSLNRSHAEVFENVDTFLEHEAPWRDGAEPYIAEIRRESTKQAAPGSAALQAAAPIEVEAWELAAQGRWVDASGRLEAAAREVGKGGSATRGYRSFLLYLSGVWLAQGDSSPAARSTARERLREAEMASERSSWLRETTPLPAAADTDLLPADRTAVSNIADRLSRGIRQDKFLARLDLAIEQLTQTKASEFEQGLVAVGEALGARAFKPEGSGRCDSAWLWDPGFWVTLEAKSEEDGDKSIPLKDVRQANTQLDMLAGDEGVSVPEGSRSIIVSPRSTPAADVARVANRNLYLAAPDDLASMAADLRSAWASLLATARTGIPAQQRAAIAGTLRDYDCLPTQAADRLTLQPIRPGD